MTMHHIATITADGVSTVAFTNIPQTYSHLQIRYSGRSLNGATTDFTYLRFNNDLTSGNYASHWLAGDGATAFASNQTGQNYFYGTIFPGGTSTANLYGSKIIDILNYASTSKTKTLRLLGGFDSNGTGAARLVSGVWLSTAALTSITCSVANAYDAAGSTLTLYGITNNPIATGQ